MQDGMRLTRTARTNGRPPVVIRPAILPNDIAEIRALDTSFTTESIHDVWANDDGFSLRSRPLDAPLLKRFSLDDLEATDRPWDRGWVSFDGASGNINGFVATQFKAWNARLAVWHLYVAPDARRTGIGRALITSVSTYARAVGARRLWVETTSVNVPGIAAYRALGFSLTGLDLTLYEGTSAEGEIALFLSRPV
ncbi:GNAT family N-acetyltransferase [Allosphingosinicella deserti]|nr:GNAT family N-acetyltransferase [Sphingomonas deserti]